MILTDRRCLIFSKTFFQIPIMGNFFLYSQSGCVGNCGGSQGNIPDFSLMQSITQLRGIFHIRLILKALIEPECNSREAVVRPTINHSQSSSRLIMSQLQSVMPSLLIDEKVRYSLRTQSIKGGSFFYRHRELFWSVLVDPSSYVVINGEGSNFPKTSTSSMLSSVFICIQVSVSYETVNFLLTAGQIRSGFGNI